MNFNTIPNAAGENAAMGSMDVLLVLIVLLALIAGIIVLQVFLSKKENKWLGLILPVISLFISLIAVFGIAAFSTVTTTASHQTIDENGVVILQEEIKGNFAHTSPEISETIRIFPASSLIFTVVSIFLLYNIPTAVLLVIYFACREKQNQKKALEKMKIQDLG